MFLKVAFGLFNLNLFNPLTLLCMSGICFSVVFPANSSFSNTEPKKLVTDTGNACSASNTIMITIELLLNGSMAFLIPGNNE